LKLNQLKLQLTHKFNLKHAYFHEWRRNFDLRNQQMQMSDKYLHEVHVRNILVNSSVSNSAEIHTACLAKPD
jgi:hypothetical protein